MRVVPLIAVNGIVNTMVPDPAAPTFGEIPIVSAAVNNPSWL